MKAQIWTSPEIPSVHHITMVSSSIGEEVLNINVAFRYHLVSNPQPAAEHFSKTTLDYKSCFIQPVTECRIEYHLVSKLHPRQSLSVKHHSSTNPRSHILGRVVPKCKKM